MADEDDDLLSDEAFGMSDDEFNAPVARQASPPQQQSQSSGRIISDDEFHMSDEDFNAPEPEGAVGSAARRFANAVVPGLAGLVGGGVGGVAGAAAGSAVPVVGTGVGGFAGSVGGYMAANAATKAAQEAILDRVAPEFAERNRRQMEANEKAHPYTSLAGELGGSMIGMSPGSVVKAGGEAMAPLVDKVGKYGAEAITRGISGAGQAVVGAASDYIEGKDQDAASLAIQFAAGALAPGLNPAGKALHNVGEGAAEGVAAKFGRPVPGRPGRTESADTAKAHEEVGDPNATPAGAEGAKPTEDAFADVAADNEPNQTVGARPDNKPTNSQGEEATGRADDSYDKRKQAAAKADNAGVTAGDMDPATRAAMAHLDENQGTPHEAPPSAKTEASAPIEEAQKPVTAPVSDEQGFPTKAGTPVATGEDVRPGMGDTSKTEVTINGKRSRATEEDIKAEIARLKEENAKEIAAKAAKVEKPVEGDRKATDADMRAEIERLKAENAKMTAAKAEEVAPKPLKERADVKRAAEALEKEGRTAEAEALRNAPDSALKDVKGLRVRKNKGGVTIHEDLKMKDGSPITANTVADAKKKAAVHEKVKAWFGKGHREQDALDKETTAQTLARIAHHNYPTGRNWQPMHKPREWLLAREARNVLDKPTASKIAKYREDERILRHGSDAMVDEFRQAKEAEYALKNARRGGDVAETAAEKTARENLAKANEEAVEKIDRENHEWLAQNYPDGTFERVDPEAIAEGTVDKIIRDARGNKERPKKTKDATAEAAPTKEEVAAQRAKDMAEARARGRASMSPEEIKKLEAAVNASDAQTKRKEIEASKKAELERAERGAPKERPLGDEKKETQGERIDRKINEFWSDESGAVGKIGAPQITLKDFVKSILNLGKGLGANVSHRKSSFARDLTPEEIANHGQYLRDIQKRFHTNEQTNKASDTKIMQGMEAMWEDSKEKGASKKETNKLKAAQQQRLFRARDADSARVNLDTMKPMKPGDKSNVDKLSPEDRALYDKHIMPLLEDAKLFKEGGDILKPDNAARDVENHIAHLADGATSEYNLLVDKGDPTGQQYNGLSVSASMANNRKYFALEDKAGNRHIIQERDEGDGYNIWKNGKSMVVKDPNFKFEANQPYVYTDKAGKSKSFTMREAMAEEKSAHARGMDQTGGGAAVGMLKYHENAGLSAALSSSLMGRRFRNLLLLHDIMAEPEFKAMSTRNAHDPRIKDNGWAESNFPNMRERVWMAPHLKEVFDTYAKAGFDTPEKWRNLNHAITKTLFWMPTAHAMNVGTHWFVGRGWDNVTPHGLKSLVVDGAKAIKSVYNQDELQRDLMKHGAGTIYPGVATRNFIQRVAQRVGEDMRSAPKGTGWRRVADIIGVPAKELANSFYDWSSRAMWRANDVFLTQRILELERKGLSRGQAIIHAERDIPNYQVPTRIMSNSDTGRFISQLMSGNDIFTFGRYHYGMWNAYANMVKDTFGKNATMADRIDGAGKMMAMGLLAYGVYPMLNKLAQFVTQNPEASQAPRGPLSIPFHLNEMRKGHEDVMGALRGTLTVTPLLSMLWETLSNRDWRGKNIVEPGDVNAAIGSGSPRQGRLRAGAKVLLQEGEHAIRGTISPYGSFANQYSKNKEDQGSALGALKDAGRMVRDQAFDVKNPSEASKRWKQKSQQLNEKDSRLREKHGGSGPAEDILNRLTR